MAAAPSIKLLSMADARLPAVLFATRPSLPLLHLPSKPLRLPYLSGSRAPSSLQALGKRLPRIPLVAQTSDWPLQEEEEENEVQDWPAEEGEGESGPEAGLSELDGEDEGEQPAAAIAADGGFAEGEESYQEPPEEAKLFVGNIPYDMDSQKLAHLFEQAGIVEVAEVIYNRDTEQSRGFGFVTMSTVEEAEKAVEMFHRYEANGRLLTVNKASPRGARVERTFEASFRIYVGNLPWQVDDSRLEQVFSEHGKVLDARVVYDRESGRSRGFGFVKMASQSEMDDAIAALDGQNLDGRALRVNVAEERPRRGSFA